MNFVVCINDYCLSTYSVAVMVILFTVISLRTPPTPWGDVSQALIYHQVSHLIQNRILLWGCTAREGQEKKMKTFFLLSYHFNNNSLSEIQNYKNYVYMLLKYGVNRGESLQPKGSN